MGAVKKRCTFSLERQRQYSLLLNLFCSCSQYVYCWVHIYWFTSYEDKCFIFFISNSFLDMVAPSILDTEAETWVASCTHQVTRLCIFTLINICCSPHVFFYSYHYSFLSEHYVNICNGRPDFSFLCPSIVPLQRCL